MEGSDTWLRTGRAEATLRAVQVGDLRLHGVRVARRAHSLDGGHMGTVEREQRQQAGVHVLVLDGRSAHRPPADHDGADAAAAHAAAELRAGQPACLAQVLDERGVQADVLDGGLARADRVPHSIDADAQRLLLHQRDALLRAPLGLGHLHMAPADDPVRRARPRSPRSAKPPDARPAAPGVRPSGRSVCGAGSARTGLGGAHKRAAAGLRSG